MAVGPKRGAGFAWYGFARAQWGAAGGGVGGESLRPGPPRARPRQAGVMSGEMLAAEVGPAGAPAADVLGRDGQGSGDGRCWVGRATRCN